MQRHKFDKFEFKQLSRILVYITQWIHFLSSVHVTVGGGGGFFLVYEDFWRMFDSSFPTCAFFFSSGN